MENMIINIKKTVLLFLSIVLMAVSADKLYSQSTVGTQNALNIPKRSPGNTSYFVDPVEGDDRNKGTSKDKAWKTFKPVNQLVLAAGDTLEILAAGIFRESLLLKAKGTQKLPVKVKFARGRYDLFPDSTLKKQVYISNTINTTTRDQSKVAALMFDNCSFVQVEASHAKFVMRGKMIETFINHCNNISLHGLSFDYQRPTVSELTVTDVKESYADLQIHRDSRYSIKDSILTWEGEGWRYQPDWYWQVLDRKTNEVQRIAFSEPIRYVAMGDNQVRAYFKQNPGFETGKVYQNRNVIRDCAGIFMQRSKNISWGNLHLYFMHGMGVVSQFCENIKLDSIFVIPQENSGRTSAAWADILHFSCCRGEIEVSNSYLSSANDDAINVHGIHLRIIDIPAPNQLKVRFMHNETFGFNMYQPGDSIDFIHTATLLPFGSNLVTASEMLNEREILVTLKKPVPGEIKAEDVIENTTWTPEVWIHNNTIARIPTRGILVTTRRKVLIENNGIQRTHMTGVLVNDDAASWYESGMVRDVTIRNNYFLQCGEPAIEILPENSVQGNAAVHSGIKVYDNTFNLVGARMFEAKSTEGILIKNNTVIMRSPLKPIEELISLKDCAGVEVTDNKIKP